MDSTTLANALACYIAADIPAFIWGAPGGGKSDTVRLVGKRLGLPVFDLRALLMESVELKGVPAIVDGRTQFCLPDFLPRADRDGARGILFLDELNAAPPSTQAALFQLVLDRRLLNYVLPEGWRIVAAGNRQSDRAAAQRMPSALANRFAHLDYETALQAFLAFVNGESESNLRDDCLNLMANSVFPEMMKAFFMWMEKRGVNLLHKMDGNADLRAFPSPRAWCQVSKVWNAPADMFPMLCAGLVGEVATGELMGFIKAAGSLPTMAEIARDPMAARLPIEPSARFAVAAMVGRAADHGTIAAAAQYLARLGAEWQALAMLEMAKRDSSLKSNAAWGQWAVANQQVAL